jgi:hypothetical protein
MIHSHAVPALLKHGYGIEQVKQWRTEQEKSGKPSTFDDFLRAHGLCVQCRSAGKFISGIHWQDSNGINVGSVGGKGRKERGASARMDGVRGAQRRTVAS